MHTVAIGLICALVLVMAAGTTAHAAPTRTIGYCEGNQVDVTSAWPGIAEGTVGVCDTITYHSTAVGLYGGPPPELLRAQQWLQSGDVLLDEVKYRTVFRTSCRRHDGTWRWIRRDGPEKKRRFVNTKSVQAYGPDVKEWEWAVTGDAAECRSEPGGRAFFGVDTLWNLTDGDCDTCGTWQHIER